MRGKQLLLKCKVTFDLGERLLERVESKLERSLLS